MNEKIQNIKNEIGKVIKGKEEVIDTVLAAMLAEGKMSRGSARPPLP